jgi:hypothetical protein
MMARNTVRPLDTIAQGALTDEEMIQVQDLQLSDKCLEAFTDASAAIQADWIAAEAGLRKRQEQNAAARQRLIERTVRKADNFLIGEYVLVLNMVPTNKLRTKWMGPYQVTGTVNDHVYTLKDLIQGKEHTVHAQRMKVFADASIDVTEDIKNSAAYDASSFVDSIVGHRENDEHSIDLRVRWSGFEENEDTWEPVEQLHMDIPFVVERYLASVSTEFPLAEMYLDTLKAARNASKTIRHQG